ncbi:MAG: T9SS type A sorting domain-containing protein, partial [Prolixibacteraceae bacterium]|nr:T9SS type A sorting domain-containing protein [Prolixibacteraceae bacterium]
GDSFITSAVLVTTTYDQGCTLTQGYWKTHSEYGPAAKPDATWAEVGGPDAAFFLSGQTYLEVLNTAVKGNAYYTLAHQFIAAELNMYAGAYLGEVADEFSEAADLLALYTPAQIGEMKGNNPVRKMFIELGEMLDKFNNGIIGPGHCDNDDMEKSATLDSSFEISEFSVYPNPASNVTTLSFNPVSDGMATVELYNSLGQKLEVLFNENVRRNVPVKVDFDVSAFNRGLYILQLKNNASVSTTKFNIGN